MAVVQYIPAPRKAPERDLDADAQKAAKAAADLEFVHEKRLQTIARRRETEIRNAQRARALIPRDLVQKQAAFLVLSLRGRLLAIPAQHARELVQIDDERELQFRLDAILREALDDIAQMPLKVSDPNWMSKIDDVEWAPSQEKRPRRAAK